MARRGPIPKRDTRVLRDDKSNYLDKELEAQKRSKVYNTQIINDIIKNLGDPKADMMPFFHGKTAWRNSDIAFEYTQEEWEILQRCAEDPIYFIENYCTFLTDYGRKTVNLRPYQKDVIHLMCDEHYSEEYELMLPDNRRVVLLQSRQTGKCVDCSTTVKILGSYAYNTIKNTNRKKYSLFRILYQKLKNGLQDILISNEASQSDIVSSDIEDNYEYSIPFYEIYYSSIKTPTLRDYITYKLYRHNKYGIFNTFILILDKIKYRKTNNNNKIIESLRPIVDIRLKSKNCYTTVTDIHRTKQFTEYIIELKDGSKLSCADEHLLFTSDLHADGWTHIKDIRPDFFVYTENGWQKVISVKKKNRKTFMGDLTVSDESHSYYTNGMLSHNTTTTAAVFTWYLTFHTDKNAMVVANKGDTAEEIIGKMTDVFKGLPYFLKPGVVSVAQDAIRFENGCSLRCSATGDSPATGDTIHMLMIDECALIPANKIGPFWRSVFPTLSSSVLSQIIVLSTPRGRHNLYYDIYTGAVNGTNGFKHKRVDYWEVPGHDTEEWKQEQVSAFGEALFNQEFGLSFDSDQSKLIGPKDLQFFNKIKKEFVPVEIYGIPYNVSSKILWHPDFHPDSLTVNDLLTRKFLLQIDTAEGKEKGEKGQEDSDYNVINIYEIEFLSPARIRKNRCGYKKVSTMDCIRFRQIGIYMDQDFDEEHCADAAQHIAFTLLKNGVQYQDYDIDNCRIMLEVNFNGANWIKTFKTHDLFYPNLILKTFHSQKATKKEYGFRLSGGEHGKGYYCEAGAKLISKRQIIISHDSPTPVLSSIQQLEAFGKTKTGKYEGSCIHDDISMTILMPSIVIECEEFIMWIDDWLEFLPYMEINDIIKNKLIMISRFLETFVVESTEEEEYSNEEYMRMVASSTSGFNSYGTMGQIPYQYPTYNNGYGTGNVYPH